MSKKGRERKAGLDSRSCANCKHGKKIYSNAELVDLAQGKSIAPKRVRCEINGRKMGSRQFVKDCYEQGLGDRIIAGNR